MRTHVLNNSTPNLKQGEDRTNTIEILVPADMRSYSLFLFFALPDGSKTFTPKLTMTDNKVSYVIPAGITAKTGRVTVELQGYLDNRLIKSVSYAFFVVAAVSTPTDPPFEDFVPWYLEVMQKADEIDRVGSDLEARLSALKIAEPQREMNELIRIHNENERIENEIQREANEVIRQEVYITKADKTYVDNKDALLVPKTTTVNTKPLSGNISVTAADVPNTPAGNIAATNVQNALNELDTEKVPKTTTVNTKALSGDISVTAADVPNTPAGNIAATTVQAALNELDTEKVPKTTTVNTKALSGDISVTAADVPNTPAGNIAATTVQAALNELDTEKAKKGLPVAICRNSVVQSTADVTTTILTFDTDVYLNDATMRDADKTKITIKRAGIYMLVAQVELVSNNTGMRTLSIKRNGTDLVRFSLPAISGAATRIAATTLANLLVNDAITVGVYHNAGTALNTATGDHSPVLSLTMLEEL